MSVLDCRKSRLKIVKGGQGVFASAGTHWLVVSSAAIKSTLDTSEARHCHGDQFSALLGVATKG